MSTTMSINKKFGISLVLGLSISLMAMGQDVLTIDEAIQIALENNYDIKVAKQNNEISQNNIYAGNAGLMPRLSVNASHSESNNSKNRELHCFLGMVSRVKGCFSCKREDATGDWRR